VTMKNKHEEVALMLYGLVALTSPIAVLLNPTLPKWPFTVLMISWIIWFTKWAMEGAIPPSFGGV
jgi:hypothetical protein